MFLANILDSKIEGEGDGSGVVCEETGCLCGGVVSVLSKVLDE